MKNAVRGKDKLHLKTDPPPDLAIEAVHSHDADAAIEVYRRFKVPEVWVCDEDELVILVLQPTDDTPGRPRVRHSRFFRPPRFTTGCAGPRQSPTPSGSRSFERWVKRTLKPRVRRTDDQDRRLRTKSNNAKTEVVR